MFESIDLLPAIAIAMIVVLLLVGLVKRQFILYVILSFGVILLLLATDIIIN